MSDRELVIALLFNALHKDTADEDRTLDRVYSVYKKISDREYKRLSKED